MKKVSKKFVKKLNQVNERKPVTPVKKLSTSSYYRQSLNADMSLLVQAMVDEGKRRIDEFDTYIASLGEPHQTFVEDDRIYDVWCQNHTGALIIAARHSKFKNKNKHAMASLQEISAVRARALSNALEMATQQAHAAQAQALLVRDSMYLRKCAMLRALKRHAE